MKKSDDKGKKIRFPKRLPKKKRKQLESKRVKKYTKFLRKNYDWDYIYIIDLLRFKIRKVRKYIKKHNIIEEHELNKIVSKMRETEKLLESLVGESE